MAGKYWITGNWGDAKQVELVIRISKRAVQVDPEYGRAWGLLALAQSILFYTFSGGGDDGLAAADRALALDPNVAEAHCVRARALHEKGELEAALEELAQALKIGPDSWEVQREAARIYYFQRRMEDAVRHYEKAVSLAENDYHSWGMLASAHQALGHLEAWHRAAKMMVKQSERVIAQDPSNGQALGIGACGLAILGDRDRFEEWVQRAMLVDPDNFIMRHNLACAYAVSFGDIERAIDLIEPVFDEIPANMARNIFTDPDLDGLRGNPRFEKILDKARGRMVAEGVAPPIPTAAATPLRS